MGLLSEGTPLDWPSTKHNSDLVRKHGIKQFIAIYNKFKNRTNDPFKWGDELEFSLIKFDHKNKRCYLLLKAEQILADLNSNSQKAQAKFHPEYASYMVEATPSLPFGSTLESFKDLEENMRLRRSLIQNKLDDDEYCMSLTNFPLLGCANFTWPNYEPKPIDGITQSLFFPDQAIFCGHPRFKTLSKNVRLRRERKPAIYVPIYKDKFTQSPFRECVKNEEFKDDMIYLDAVGFGMGCCCLQTTFQAESIKEARCLYDQLAPITPIILALSASSPIWRGYLSNVDCRWNVISGSVDDRTKEEQSKHGDYSITKSRYDSIDSYLSVKDPELNDVTLKMNESAYNNLKSNQVDDLLSRHIAHLFIRDPIVLFKEKLTNNDSETEINDADHFENIQSTNWQTMRFKPPPIPQPSDNPSEQIGWRVEFRTPEIQLTDFENSAFCTFIILLVRAIQRFDLNFLIPISKVDENMQRAQNLNACLDEKFYFLNNRSIVTEMTINEIINGSEEKGFSGLLSFITDYLNQMKDVCICDAFTECKINQYLLLIKSRANGDLLTLASLIRKLVREHPDYKHDSVVNEKINYDLIWRLHQISNGTIECPEFLFKSFKTSCI